MILTAGERFAASIVVFMVAAMTVAYAIDRAGLTIAPVVVLVTAVAAAATAFVTFRTEPFSRGEAGALRAASSAGRETVAFFAIVGATLAYLLWLARPALLPIGSGPDLTHHLMLVDYIERHWRLAHDPALGAVMGEMADYTPGFHLLAVLAGAWTRTDGFHAAYPVLALTIALKAGFVFLIALRLLSRSAARPDSNARAIPHAPAPVRRDTDESELDSRSNAPPAPPSGGSGAAPNAAPWPRTLFAVAAVVLLFAPREYFLRSFTEHSFLAQVVSELFAVAMWWALVVWDERPSRAAMILFAIAGIGTFLTWPVWIGPLVLVLVAIVGMRSDLPLRERLASLALAGAPIAVVAAVHAAGRVHAAGIAGTAGFVVWPSVEMFGWWFLVLAGAGLIAAALDRRTRSLVWLVAAIALQAAALFMVARRSGADRPYLALKMVYLLVYPLAVAGAVTLPVGTGWMGWKGGMGWKGRIGGSPSRLSRLSCPLVVLALAAVVAGGLIREPRHQPVVSTPMYLAGQWARANLNAACIDYLVRDDDSAYWLHLAVLGNARQTDRTRDSATFDPKQALIRWIQPEGLPYAIADDLDALPKDIRTSIDIVQRFGPAAIVKRRGRSTCDESNRGAR